VIGGLNAPLRVSLIKSDFEIMNSSMIKVVVLHEDYGGLPWRIIRVIGFREDFEVADDQVLCHHGRAL